NCRICPDCGIVAQPRAISARRQRATSRKETCFGIRSHGGGPDTHSDDDQSLALGARGTVLGATPKAMARHRNRTQIAAQLSLSVLRGYHIRSLFWRHSRSHREDCCGYSWRCLCARGTCRGAPYHPRLEFSHPPSHPGLSSPGDYLASPLA